MKLPLITILIMFIFNYSNAKELKHERRIALVIGNSTYQRPFTVLSNTLNDAQAIRTILSNRGFDVIYKENISLRAFNNVLEKFYKKLGDKGVGLLYFSGHGLEFNGQNYLIPTDANIKIHSDAQYEAVPLNKITHRIQQLENRLNIVILDACRNDPFVKGDGIGGLTETTPIGLFVAYATGAGQVSSGGRVGGYGLFTQYLIENMKKPLNLQDVFKATRASVYDKSERTQFPAIYDQIVKGDFYFTLPNDNSRPLISTPIIAPQLLSEYTPLFKVYAQSDINRQKTIPASISIKNQGVWQSGMKFKKGEYKLTISAKNYQTQSYTITINSNQGFDFQLPLIVKKIKKPSYESASNTNAELRKQGKLIPHPIHNIDFLHNDGVKFDRRYSRKSFNTVRDNKTGLIWPKLIPKNDMNLNDAKKHCSNLSLDGYRDWRLPTIKELASLTHPLHLNVVIPNQKYFTLPLSKLPFTSLRFWSSTKVKERDEYIPGFGFRTIHNPPYSKISGFNYSSFPYEKVPDSMPNNALCVFLDKSLQGRLTKISESTFDEEKARREIDEMLKAADASVSY